MIRVHKPIEPPAHLRSEQVERAFAEMIATGQYLDKHDSQYKAAEVRTALRACYHNKCAYCEKDLRDHDQPIDHYRPKARRRQEKGDPLVAADIGYFWLAFSWDNLQLVCNQCNRSKSTYFKIFGIAASYQGEALAELHFISTTYDQQEKPLLINPAIEPDPEALLQFHPDGRLTATDPRMAYTLALTTAGQRQQLVDARREVLNKYRDRLHTAFNQCVARLISRAVLRDRFSQVFQDIQNQTQPDRPFSAWHRYLLRAHQEVFAMTEAPPPFGQLFAKWLAEAMPKP